MPYLYVLNVKLSPEDKLGHKTETPPPQAQPTD
jgi:hypothetical protein